MGNWPSPYSPLPISDIVASNDVALDFDGTVDGLHVGAGAAGEDTGFTIVQPSTSEQSTTIDPGGLYQGYYLPQYLSIADEKLTINATKGIAYLTQGTSNNDRWKNTQDNTLGVPLNPAGKKLLLSTTMTTPSNASDSAQGGLWFGPSDDNYVKLVVLTGANGARQVQLSREVSGVTNSGAPDQATSASTTTITATTAVTLSLTIDAIEATASATYKIGDGAVTTLGSVALPASFTDGSLVPTTFDTVDAETNGFGGVFATRRNMTDATTPVPFTFENFTVEEIDATPPAAPESLIADASPDQTALSWTAPADADVAGYRVYRAATAPVEVIAGNLVSGEELLETTAFDDTNVFVGQSWEYAVYAVDTSGNVSEAAASASATTPAPEGELVEKFDFTTAAATAADGYTKDSGAAYDAGTGWGWITADDGTPFNFSINSRVRTTLNGITDGRLTSLTHMQYGLSTNPNPSNGVDDEQGVWEYDLPNGVYNVVVAGGDTSNGNFDSTHTIVVEGVTAIDAFDGLAPLYFEQGVVEVEVTDGTLTVAPTGGINTKISFLEIYEVEAAPLATPADFTATLGGDDASVDLSWTAVDGAEEYNVYRSGSSPVDTATPLNSAALSGTTFTDTDVTPGETYYYTVIATSSSTPASAAATEQSVEIPSVEPVAPDAPSGVAATADEDSILIEWDEVTGATGYKVFRGATSDVATDGVPVSGEAPLAALSFDDTGAEPGTEYFYVVLAVGEGGLDSEASAVVSAAVEEAPGPGECYSSEWSAQYFAGTALAGASIASECLTELDRTLAWGESPAEGVPSERYSARFARTIDVEAGMYEFSLVHDDGVRLLVDGEVVFDAFSPSNGSVTKTVAVPLAAGEHDLEVEYFQERYSAKLIVDWEFTHAACAASEWSAQYFAGTALAGASIASECLTELDRTLAWGESPAEGVPSERYSARFARTIDVEAGMYEFSLVHDDGVRLLVDGEVVFDAFSPSNGSVTKTVAVPLAAGEHDLEVEYFQERYSAKLIVDWENPDAVDTTPPSAPTGANTVIGGDSITVQWTPSDSTDVVGYNVYRGTETGVTAETGQQLTLLLVSGVGATSFEDLTPMLDTLYYYVVTAVDESGNESDVSNEATGIIETVVDTDPPAAPEGLAAGVGDAEVVLTWDAVDAEDLAGYRVYRSLETGAHTGDVVVSGDALLTDPTYTDLDVDNNTTYFYQVVAVDHAGNESDPSNEAVATPRVPNTTDISVDFLQTNGVPVPGYVADWGQAYGERTGFNQGTGLTYGWVDSDGHALSLVGNGRDRGRTGIDDLLDSIIHMQYGDVDGGAGTNGILTPGAWEIAVPNGLYEVTVAVGDQMGAESYDSQHTVNVEGSVAINGFQGSASQEYETYTATVGVWDGNLTLDALGGFNTKLAYVEIDGIEFDRPHVDAVNPLNRANDADITAGVAATFQKVHAGGGVNDTTMPGNVKVFNVATGEEVPGSVNTSGGNDTVNFDPDGEFEPNTTYRFVVTSDVKDLFGNSFVPFESIFTTGAGVIVGGDEFTPLTNVAFEKVQITLPGVNKLWASFAFGPDEKLYGTTIGQGIWRFDVDPDTGALSNMTDLGYQGFAMIGLLWDKDATADDLKVWITKTSANVGNEQAQFISGISLLEGPNLENEKKVFAGLPRSQSDHLTNSMIYGPGGDIFVLQGSNSAAGDPDSSWGQRGEQLLTAALLHFDPEHARVQQAITDAEGDDPQLVQTASSGSSGENATNGYDAGNPYDPWAANAPLQIYATGIRNAYDLVYHSNGHVYVATNGTAGGGNSPGVDYNATTETWTRVAASGIPGYSTVNGQDLTAACEARADRDPSYVPRSIPPISNHPTQRDHLYDVVEGGYYGHPNPTRCEFVLHEGNDPDNPPQWAGQGGSKYVSGVLPESHYKGVAYDFEYNKSPNGTIEYMSKTYGGQLEHRIIVVRFSNNNDLIFLQADQATGEILGGQTEVGITGVPNSTISGVGGFNDPLEVVEDTRNGNLYVNQYDRAGSSQGLFLLRVPASQQAAKIASDQDELVFSAVTSNGALVDSTEAHRTDAELITVTNQSTEAQSLAAAITGANATEFSIPDSLPTSLAAGASVTFTVRFTPGTTGGERSAQLVLTGGSSDVTVPLYGLAMVGIQGGYEPTLDQVLGTLGYEVNVGWTSLAGGMDPGARGDEVLEPLFVKSGSGPVTWKPLAQYAPADTVSFGWYTGDGGPTERNELGAMDGTKGGGYQSLLPPATSGSTLAFDPGTDAFGVYYYSPYFSRFGFTEDRLNSPAADAHRARIYPAKNRNGVTISNTYIVAFEDASNGDYQDYVFLVSGLKPVTDTGSGSDAIKVDFTTASGGLAAGYVRDYGQPFGSRTGADQGSGLVYGWKDVDTEVDLDISVGGSTPGNGRDRGTSQADMRLDSFMHMQPESISGTFNGTQTDAYWEIALPNGTYELTIGVGDPAVNSDPESHVINAEGVNIVSAFVPSGAAGSDTRHKISTGTVEVTDGFLTIDPLTGVNTKIGFIDIVPLDVTDPGDTDPSDGAQVKVNFQPASAPVPDGWTAETGGAFTTERGFGWFNEADDQPVDRSAATRYRTGALSGITYPTDERLKTYAFIDNSTQPAYTSGYWEYVVPNGTYDVAVSVGDANYLDSTHGVLVEGQPIINGFVPTASTPFQTGVRTVTVSDGRLTVTNSGDNTKINWISIKGDGLDTSEPTATEQFSFRPASAAVPAGWTADTGAAYDAATGYGWLVDGSPFDRSSMTRLRGAPAGDPLLQGLILMQNVTTTGSTITGGTIGVWERALANGSYTVTASVGDGEYTDSIHGLAAEGEPLITDFVPTTGTPFTTGTAEVLVTDGKLTLSATGVNTKINWVTITGTALSAPSLVLSVNGAAIDDAYEGGEATVTASALAATGATIDSLTYSIDGATPIDYTEPFVIDEVGEYEVVFEATDSEGRVSTRTVAFTVLDIGGTLELTNTQIPHQPNGDAIPGLYDDVVTLHRINSGTTDPDDGTLLYRSYDSAVVNVTNTGAKDLRITALSLGGAQPGQFDIVDAPTLPLLIAPDETVPLTVQFVGNTGSKGIRTATVSIASSDTSAAITPLHLRAGYMTSPEGGNELTLAQLIDLFDSNTSIGTTSASLVYGSENHGSALNGEEVRSGMWQRLDSSKPVQAVQLAAFHGQGGGETLNIGGNSVSMTGLDAQSTFPKTGAGNPVALSIATPATTFAMSVSGQSTNRTDYMAVKLWPVKDRSGKVIAGSWFLAHDYISSVSQCGIGATNCDYQDNLYLVTNVLPVTPDDAAPAAPAAPAGVADTTGVDLTWAASSDADLIGYRIERAADEAGPWTTVSGTGVLGATTFRDTTAGPSTATYYRVVAVDATGNATAGASTAVDTSSIDEPPIRINAGGPTVATGGVTWVADTPYLSGTGTKSYSNAAVTQIAGTTDDVLYLTERSTNADLGTINYAIPVTGSGDYEITMHFAEIYWGATGGGAGGTGKRVFSVNFEGGATEITNLDLNALVAPMTAYTTTNTIAVTDGTLNIALTASVNQPKVSAIEVVKVS
ncbi:PA14 domain-containing protein [Demequina maris]|uniref:PA14 domain-containing protein n=1 Tax=Demequina maris TaxID=1638982 RepID=UPI000781FC1A|nr:PA14 domain-containing protein [Demequina maris]